MLRFVIATITGLIAGSLLIFLGNVLYLSLNPIDAVDTYGNLIEIDYNSEISYWTRIVAHAFGAFIAGLVAALVAIKTKYSSGITAFLVLFIGIIYFLFDNVYPTWFVVADISITAILGFVGILIGASRNV